MSALSDALEAVQAAVGALLPSWSSYLGFAGIVHCPAFIVGVPQQVAYNAGTQGRARYTVPITGAADLTAPLDLVAFLTHDGLAAELQGATASGWWGGLLVTEAGDTRVVPNGAGEALASDIIVSFYA